MLYFVAQMHALALKDKEEEHAGLLHDAGKMQVWSFCSENIFYFPRHWSMLPHVRFILAETNYKFLNKVFVYV